MNRGCKKWFKGMKGLLAVSFVLMSVVPVWALSGGQGAERSDVLKGLTAPDGGTAAVRLASLGLTSNDLSAYQGYHGEETKVELGRVEGQPALIPAGKATSIVDFATLKGNPVALRLLGKQLETELVSIPGYEGVTRDDLIRNFNLTMEAARYNFRFTPENTKNLFVITDAAVLSDAAKVVERSKGFFGLKPGEAITRIVLLESRPGAKALQGILKNQATVLALVPALEEDQIVAGYQGILVQQAEAGKLNTVGREILQIRTVPEAIKTVTIKLKNA